MNPEITTMIRALKTFGPTIPELADAAEEALAEVVAAGDVSRAPHAMELIEIAAHVATALEEFTALLVANVPRVRAVIDEIQRRTRES